MRIGNNPPGKDANLKGLSAFPRDRLPSVLIHELFQQTMNNFFDVGDVQVFQSVVAEGDLAGFGGEIVHPVCATFALARDIEWTSRQFVLKLRDDDEEGIGTMLTINHVSPAFVGEEIIFTARIQEIKGNELVCSYEARVGDRLIAYGKTGQKILKREKINRIFKN